MQAQVRHQGDRDDIDTTVEREHGHYLVAVDDLAPPAPVGAASRSASICSSSASDSFCPSRSKNLTRLYSGGLWEAVITQPRSSVSSATAGVGGTPATTAFPPAEAIPLASACSSS